MSKTTIVRTCTHRLSDLFGSVVAAWSHSRGELIFNSFSKGDQFLKNQIVKLSSLKFPKSSADPSFRVRLVSFSKGLNHHDSIGSMQWT